MAATGTQTVACRLGWGFSPYAGFWGLLVATGVLHNVGNVLQILLNLIRNEKYACDEGGQTPKLITLRIFSQSPQAGHPASQ